MRGRIGLRKHRAAGDAQSPRASNNEQRARRKPGGPRASPRQPMRIHISSRHTILPLLLAAFAAHADVDRLPREVDALAWEVGALERTTPEGDKQMLFPEQLDEAPAPGDWRQRKSLGIVFSGGGVRSAAATLGQLRALNLLGWYDRAQYVSSVSGGAWGSIPYTFLPSAYDEKVFLGPYRDPAALRNDDLDAAPRHSFAHAISDVKVYGTALRGWATLTGDETFASVLGKVFLQPFGLDEDRSFARSPRHVLQIVARNDGCNPPTAWNQRRALPRVACPVGERAASSLTPDDFIVPQRPRPLHIVGSVLVLQRGLLQKGLPPQWMHPVDITPYYTGTREAATHVFAGTGATQNVGGLYVESFAYDTKRPLPVARLRAQAATPMVYRAERKAGLFTRFRLRDVLAASGAAPQETASGIGFRNLGFPEIRHWALDDTGLLASSKEIAHGDGGHIDNIGLLPLLARGVRNIVVFVNTPYPFQPAATPGDSVERSVTPDLVSYFDRNDRNYVIKKAQGCRDRVDCTPLRDLHDHYSKLRDAGEPLVHCDQYTIQARSAQQPRMPYVTQPTNICWVYLDAPAKWTDKVLQSELDPGLKADIALKQNDMKRFPNYNTFFENDAQVIRYTDRQISALAHLTAWTMCQSAATIGKRLDADLGLRQACAG
jgi:hypothetical protein